MRHAAVDAVRTAFNAQPGAVLLVTLLSPT
jgi:hypothetical protein